MAFPAISTGIFGYPVKAAARTAVATLSATLTSVKEVTLVCFDEETFDAYSEILTPR